MSWGLQACHRDDIPRLRGPGPLNLLPANPWSVTYMSSKIVGPVCLGLEKLPDTGLEEGKLQAASERRQQGRRAERVTPASRAPKEQAGSWPGPAVPPLRARGAQRSPGAPRRAAPAPALPGAPGSERCHLKIILGKAVPALSRAWRAPRAPGTDAGRPSARTVGAKRRQRGVPGCAPLHRGFAVTHSAGLASAGPGPGLGKRHSRAFARVPDQERLSPRSERPGPHPLPCGPRRAGRRRRRGLRLARVRDSGASAAGRTSSPSRHRQGHVIFLTRSSSPAAAPAVAPAGPQRFLRDRLRVACRVTRAPALVTPLPAAGAARSRPPARGGGGRRGTGAGHTLFAPAGRAGLPRREGLLPGPAPKLLARRAALSAQPAARTQPWDSAPRLPSSETNPHSGSRTSGAAARPSGGTSGRTSGGRDAARPLSAGTERQRKFWCACPGCPRPIGALPSVRDSLSRSPEGRARADGPGEAAPSLPVAERPAALRCRPALRRMLFPLPGVSPAVRTPEAVSPRSASPPRRQRPGQGCGCSPSRAAQSRGQAGQSAPDSFRFGSQPRPAEIHFWSRGRQHRRPASWYHRLFHPPQPAARFRVYFLPPTWKMPARLLLTAPPRAAEPLPLSGGEGSAPGAGRPRAPFSQTFSRGKLYRTGHRRAAPAHAGVTLLKFVTQPSPRGAAVVRPLPVRGRGEGGAPSGRFCRRSRPASVRPSVPAADKARLSDPAHFAMCSHGVKAQEGAVLGGVGPARRGRAGQRRGGAARAGGSRDRGARQERRRGGPRGHGSPAPGTAPRHRAPRGGGAGPPRGPRLLAQREKVARSPRGGCGAGQGRGRCAGRAGGAGARRAGRLRSGTRGIPAAAACPCRESRGGGGSSGKGRGVGVRGPCGGRGRRGRGGMELPEGPASRPCGCDPAAEEQFFTELPSIT
ncbi:collagen, type I, alpha 1b-like [Prinia subflava]|uniref:collagen, type I, alpha 1b-like n=1 Tax=Prinia subflava TaxID=208062 RepID=UPI002FE1A102